MHRRNHSQTRRQGRDCGTVLEIGCRFRRWRDRRIAASEIMALDRHILRDIGVDRVRDAVLPTEY